MIANQAPSDDESESEYEMEEDDEDENEEFEAGDRCDFCGRFNPPPFDVACIHFCGWVWDGFLDAFRDARDFDDARKYLVDLVAEVDLSSETAVLLKAEAGRNQTCADLIATANEDSSFLDVLTQLAGAQTGSGWSTSGMLSGYGFNVYVKNPDRLVDLAKECRAIVAACHDIKTGSGNLRS